MSVDQQLVWAERQFADQQRLIDAFFEAASGAFEHAVFQSTSLTREGAAAGVLHTLGYSFPLRFKFHSPAPGQSMLILEVARPMLKDETVLERWYIDQTGNVRKTPILNAFTTLEVRDPAFVQQLVLDAQRALFQKVHAELPAQA